VIFTTDSSVLEELVSSSAPPILHHALSQPGADRLGYAGLHRGSGQGGHFDALWYADEVLADELACWYVSVTPAALAEQVIDLLETRPKRHAMRKRAYLYGREMICRRSRAVTWRVSARPSRTRHFSAARCRQSTRQTSGRTARLKTRSLTRHDR